MNRSRELINAIFSVNRNYTTEELAEKKIDIFNQDVCKNYLVLGYCPYYALTGCYKNRFSCSKIHDQTFHTQFNNLSNREQYHTRSQVLSNLNSLVRYMDNKIKYSIENLNSSRRRTKELEQQNILRKAKKKINLLYNRIKENKLNDLTLLRKQIRELNELSSFVYKGKDSKEEYEGRRGTEETSDIIDKIKNLIENDSLLESKNRKTKDETGLLSIPQASICFTCGAYILDNDSEQRALSHLTGKIHTSFYTIRKSKRELEQSGVQCKSEYSRKNGNQFNRSRNRMYRN
eukprot:GAHX01000806.1.p1 GENE.GAHX01000806.1~~GAHX01000806.1.p1  ORF type:complete len:290 (+),score=53.32 GAHX01000806.1:903-1772(+)